MKKPKHPRCSCRKQTDPRCQFHNKLKGLLSIKEPSQQVKDTIAEMRELENGKVFRREPFSVGEILERRAEKNKGAKPCKALTHNPFEKLAEMKE